MLAAWLKKTNFNAKVTEIEGKILSITGLATNSALTTIENIPDISSVVKKVDYNTKISDIEKKIIDHNHDKYFTTPEFNVLAADVFNARIRLANLITKRDLEAVLKKISDRAT